MLMRRHGTRIRSQLIYAPLCHKDRNPQWVTFPHSRHTSSLGPHTPIPRNPHSHIRAVSTASGGAVQNVAVLGGGVTGLASAYYITEEFPDAHITIYDSKSELGGWLKSTVVDVGDGEVIFESGPRSLRPQPPNGTLALRLAQKLGIHNDLLVTPQSAPAAQNRFIYYPNRLIRMPRAGAMFDNFRTLLTEDVFAGLFSALWKEVNTETRPATLTDESVGSFINRRFGGKIADNLVSALFHGIYAGDIYELSAKSIMPMPWIQEVRHDRLVAGIWDSMFKREAWQFCDDVELQMKLQEGGWSDDMRAKMLGASVFTFRNGVGQLTEALERTLLANPKVTIHKSVNASAINHHSSKTDDVQVTSTRLPGTAKRNGGDEHTVQTFSHCVATIPSSKFADITGSNLDAVTKRALDSTYAVTVAVVNLYFRTPHLLTTLLPPNTEMRHLTPNGLQGFGYLIPRSVPFEMNPERALGVIFDSDISPELHTTVAPDKLGTRLTVMLGGHWWDGWAAYPSNEECIEMARSVLERHLGLTEEPVAAVATLQRDCIPQYTVGHSERMATAHSGLRDAFKGRLRVAGSWYTGVGVNDCLRSAHDVVQGLKRRSDGTGLEQFASPRPMALVRRAQKGVVEVVKVDEGAKGFGFFGGSKDKP